MKDATQTDDYTEKERRKTYTALLQKIIAGNIREVIGHEPVYTQDKVKEAKYLLENGASLIQSDLNAYLENSLLNYEFALAELFVEAGADPNHRYVIDGAIHFKSLPMLELLKKHGGNMAYDNGEAMGAAYRAMSLPIAAYLLGEGCPAKRFDIRYKTPTPLQNFADWAWASNSHSYPDATIKKMVADIAFIGAYCELHPKSIDELVDSALVRDEMLYGKKTNEVGRALRKETTENLGTRLLKNGGEIKDMLEQYRDTVLLPFLAIQLEKAYPAEKKNIARNYADTFAQTPHYLDKMLLPVAARLLLKDKTPLEIVELAREWHKPQKSIPDSWRPMRAGVWHPLIPEWDTGLVATIENNNAPVIIKALTNQAELARESRMLGHCVGTASYGTQCKNGQTHILSVQAAGMPLATIEVELNENGKPVYKQIEGKNEEKNPKIGLDAWNCFLEALKNKSFTLNPEPFKGWGETEESKLAASQFSHVEQIAGFSPTLENINRCHNFFREKVRVKIPALKKSWVGQNFQTEFNERGTVLCNCVHHDDVETALVKAGLDKDFNQMIRTIFSTEPVPLVAYEPKVIRR